VADFVNEPVEPHDVVVMHRVVCCYPDVDRLVGIAAANTRRRLLLTYPRERPWTRAGIAAVNLFMRISGSDFRAFVHPVARMTAAAEREGLALEHREQPGLIWENAAYERV
jgi:magnesium-protoporphyrin O-methyltransferase